MLKVGLTGGIGSGKSTVATIFRTLGIPVYDADSRARELMQQDPALREALLTQFGEAAFENGKLNRAYLARIVFNDPGQLERLNQLIHPVTIRDAENWMNNLSAPYAVKEAALLFESGAVAGLDYVVGVTAPVSLRMQRVMQRDGLSREQVQQRMLRQLDDTIKMKLCDAVLFNDEQRLLLPQVLELHERLLKMAAAGTSM